MLHPLSSDVTKLTDEEILSQIKKLYTVLRTCGNMSITRQAEMILAGLQEEQLLRADKKMEEQLDKLGTKITDVINIK